MEIDPVCGMELDPEEAEFRAEYEGRPFYFCSSACKASFDGDPEEFAESD